MVVDSQAVIVNQKLAVGPGEILEHVHQGVSMHS
jgi:hypothetical protein